MEEDNEFTYKSENYLISSNISSNNQGGFIDTENENEIIEEERESELNLLNKLNKLNKLNPSNLSVNEKAKEIIFRNYIPISETFSVEKANFLIEINKLEKLISKKSKKSVKEFINLDKDLSELIPLESNLDYKRQLKKKSSALEIKTEIAINELLLNNISN